VTPPRYIGTRSDAVIWDASTKLTRSDSQERVVEEEDDGLRLLIVVAACGVVVAPFRRRAEHVLAPAETYQQNLLRSAQCITTMKSVSSPVSLLMP